jgi:hypothetical protein
MMAQATTSDRGYKSVGPEWLRLCRSRGCPLVLSSIHDGGLTLLFFLLASHQAPKRLGDQIGQLLNG